MKAVVEVFPTPFKNYNKGYAVPYVNLKGTKPVDLDKVDFELFNLVKQIRNQVGDTSNKKSPDDITKSYKLEKDIDVRINKFNKKKVNPVVNLPVVGTAKHGAAKLGGKNFNNKRKKTRKLRTKKRKHRKTQRK